MIGIKNTFAGLYASHKKDMIYLRRYDRLKFQIIWTISHITWETQIMFWSYSGDWSTIPIALKYYSYALLEGEGERIAKCWNLTGQHKIDHLWVNSE